VRAKGRISVELRKTYAELSETSPCDFKKIRIAAHKPVSAEANPTRAPKKSAAMEILSRRGSLVTKTSDEFVPQPNLSNTLPKLKRTVVGARQICHRYRAPNR
jgi:hypothetical protein